MIQRNGPDETRYCRWRTMKTHNESAVTDPLPLSDDQIRGAPFHLGTAALAWVKTQFHALSLDGKLAQVVLPAARDLSYSAKDRLAARGMGGVHRFPSYSEQELRRSAERITGRSSIPPLLTADIEMSEKSSVRCGTSHPNQMAVAATGNRENAYRMGAIAAREEIGRAHV